MANTACGDPPTPPTETPTIHATEIVDEYIFAKQRANERYKNRWFTVTANPTLRIDHTIGFNNYRWPIRIPSVISRHRDNEIHLLFQSMAEVQAISHNDHVTAVCQFRDKRYSAIVFQHCHMTDPPTQRIRR